MTKYTVLLSVYAKEQPAYLKQSLDSIFSQTLPPDEVVLVEDGPLPKALETMVDTYADRLKVVRLAENKGLGLALQEGLKHCSHDLVGRMDTDDICLNDRFESQVAYLEAHPETDVVGGWVDEYSPDMTQRISTRKVPEQHDEILAFSKKRNPMNHPTVMFRKAAVEQVGSYRDCQLFEDYDLWVRLFRQGAHFYNMQRPLLHFRLSDQMFSRRGGTSYIRKEYRFQWQMFRQHHIGLSRLLGNIGQRTLIRLLPNGIRKFLYLFLLRK